MKKMAVNISRVANWNKRPSNCLTVLWEGSHESRRCSRDTYPESYITKYTSIRRLTPLCEQNLAEKGVDLEKLAVKMSRVAKGNRCASVDR